ncbi:hypothetical protein HLI_09215 [Halobacillus litoralis]|uniref:Uncharacterized protein n=1 Tax=Halobacillus litoralis TaxID=45668 RepID=A0A410MIS4_9BACI|nr:hypothetical protein HLI_09215 [Halobacillus litoralis]
MLPQKQKEEEAFKGTILEGRERKYTIINERDREKYLTPEEKRKLDSALFHYLSKIEDGRARDGKEPFNSYLVVNVDEPYSNEIAETIKRNGHLK